MQIPASSFGGLVEWLHNLSLVGGRIRAPRDKISFAPLHCPDAEGFAGFPVRPVDDEVKFLVTAWGFSGTCL